MDEQGNCLQWGGEVILFLLWEQKRGVERMKWNLRSSRNIWIMSMFIFLAVAASMLFSTYYMNISIQEEENAQTRRAEYRQLGENLANASDYLTAEVRYFAITGDEKHLSNYWDEIFHTRQREEAIETFERNHPPENEKKLLEQAKQYSDLLVETEIYSMKLVLVSMGKTPGDYDSDSQLKRYVGYVLSYESPAEMNTMTTEEMRSKAIDILYDDNYENYKTEIMTPIDEFKEQMNSRLDEEVEQRKEGTRIATVIQIVLAAAALLAIGFLLNIMNHLYIRPLKGYTKEICAAGDYSDHADPAAAGDIQILRAKIVPYGAMELIRFAEAFNQMIDMFFEELRHRKNAEESMRKARNEAEDANQAKSIFLAQMSHELRTPLNAVNGYTYLLEQTDLAEKQKEYLHSIRYSSNGLLELINQILDFSKIEAGHLELECVDFDLWELMHEVHAIFMQQASRKGLKLSVQLEEEVPHVVKGDSLRMRQVMVNLIGNAIKFTEAGEIRVLIRLLEMQSESCLLFFAIEDTGIGVEETVREKIFQPFTQSDASVTRKYGGTGLGLPICSEIIALSGDQTHRLNLKSELGKGSVFSFEMDFPLSGKRAEELEAKKIQVPDCRGKKVLIADDSEINIHVQSEILALCKITVVAAESGKKAIQILERQSDIDLIFMDIRMPEMDGYEAAANIRQMKPYKEIPIIALTADAVPEVRDKIKKAGMNDCLLKPVRQEKLFALLEAYFGRMPASVEEIPALEESAEAAQTVYFDEAACLQQLNGNRSALEGIVERFLILHQDDAGRLGTLLESKDYVQAEECVHQLKGITGNLYCPLLQECCARFQDELREGKGERLDEFVRLWEHTIQRLEHFREQSRCRADDAAREGALQGQGSDFDQMKFKELCNEILRLSRDHDTEAVALVEGHMEQLSAFCEPETVQRLREAVLRYDFTGIGKAVEHILETADSEKKEMTVCTK